MSSADKKLLKEIDSWPEEDRQEIAKVAREIESRRTGNYRLSDAERAAIRQGIDAAAGGEGEIKATSVVERRFSERPFFPGALKG
jgi:radical SAM superfamily enzyme YgiQ (UPF0313 family)